MHEAEPQHTNSDEVEYVGGPTEYADAEEVPDWVETGTKAIFALPTIFAAFSTLGLVLFVIFLACAASFVCLLLAL